MLCVDILHEFELGVWKALLQHLIRMLHAAGEPEIVELDRRYFRLLVLTITWGLMLVFEPDFGRSLHSDVILSAE